MKSFGAILAVVFGLAIPSEPVCAADNFQLLVPSNPQALALDPHREPLAISINAKGEVFIQATKVELGEMVAKLKPIARDNPNVAIFVRADKATTYGQILEVMIPIESLGFTKLSLIVQLPRVPNSR